MLFINLLSMAVNVKSNGKSSVYKESEQHSEFLAVTGSGSQ
jgi:hypothetical protein